MHAHMYVFYLRNVCVCVCVFMYGKGGDLDEGFGKLGDG